MPYILIFVLVCSVLGLLIGLWKGARKKIAGITAILLSALTSLLVTPPLIKLIFSEDTVNVIIDAIGFTEQYNELVTASPAIKELILGLPVALVAPIIFLIIYAILRGIFRIVAGIVSKVVFKKNNWVISRVVGMPLGFVQGLLAAMVVVVIVAGTVSTVNNITDTILEQDSEQLAEIQTSVAEVDQYVNIVAEDPLVKFLEGKNFIYDSLNSFDFQEEKVVLNQELSSIVEAGVYLLPLTENPEIANWTEDEFAVLDSFVDKFGQSKILPQVSSEFLSAACAKWADGEAFMGINPPEADDNIDPILIALYASFKTSTAETIVVDLGTVVDLLEVLDKHELISVFLSESGTTDLMSCLKGEFISEFLSVIATNDRFNVLIPEVTNLSMKMLGSAINLPQNSEEIYNNITTDLSTNLNNVLSGERTEETVQQFTTTVSDSLKSNGIEVSDEVATVVAETIITAFEDKENVTAEDIQNYFSDYATVYEAIENLDIEVMAGNGPVKLNGSSGKKGKASANYDYKNMNFDDKIGALSTIGVLDKFNTKNDLSAPSNTLANGMNADQFVNYVLSIYNSINANFETVSALGKAENNPLVALKSPETMITTKVTVEDLLVKADEYEVNLEDVQKIAESFESLTEFVDSYSKVEGSVSLENLADINLEAAGKALDLLQNTTLLGDKVGAVADTIISDMVGSSVSVSDKVNNSDATFESLMTTVKDTSTVIGNLSNDNKTEEEKEQDVVNLLLNLTPETSDIVTTIVTKDFMMQYGVRPEYAEVSSTALKAALVEMAKLPETEHDIEAARLQSLLALTSNAGSSSKPMIGENGVFKTTGDIIGMMLDSKVAYKTLSTISTDANGGEVRDAFGLAHTLSTDEKAELENEITATYNEGKVSMSAAELAELANKLNLISTFFDLTVKVG